MGRQFDRSSVVRAQTGKTVVMVDVQTNTSVPAGTQNQTLILAPAGKIGKVLSGYLYVPGIGAATATHTLQIQPNIAGVQWVVGIGDAVSAVSWERGVMIVLGAGAKTYPTSDTAQVMQAGQMYFDSTLGLVVTYKNDSNTAQAGTRIVRLQVLYEDVV